VPTLEQLTPIEATCLEIQDHEAIQNGQVRANSTNPQIRRRERSLERASWVRHRDSNRYGTSGVGIGGRVPLAQRPQAR
jgi:hypothetical protein